MSSMCSMPTVRRTNAGVTKGKGRAVPRKDRCIRASGGRREPASAAKRSILHERVSISCCRCRSISRHGFGDLSFPRRCRFGGVPARAIDRRVQWEWQRESRLADQFEGSFRGRDLPDKEFDTSIIRRVGVLLADKQAGSFDLEVDWIRTYGEGHGVDHGVRGLPFLPVVDRCGGWAGCAAGGAGMVGETAGGKQVCRRGVTGSPSGVAAALAHHLFQPGVHLLHPVGVIGGDVGGFPDVLAEVVKLE